MNDKQHVQLAGVADNLAVVAGSPAQWTPESERRREAVYPAILELALVADTLATRRAAAVLLQRGCPVEAVVHLVRANRLQVVEMRILAAHIIALRRDHPSQASAFAPSQRLPQFFHRAPERPPLMRPGTGTRHQTGLDGAPQPDHLGGLALDLVQPVIFHNGLLPSRASARTRSSASPPHTRAACCGDRDILPLRLPGRLARSLPRISGRGRKKPRPRSARGG